MPVFITGTCFFCVKISCLDMLSDFTKDNYKQLAIKLLSTRKLEKAIVIFAVIIGLVEFWVYRLAFNPDWLAYMDIADAWLKADWRFAVNSSWSPLYSWLLTIPILLSNSPKEELFFSHLLQLVFYLALIPVILRFVGKAAEVVFQNINPSIFAANLFRVLSLLWVFGLLLRFSPIRTVNSDLLQFFAAILIGLFLINMYEKPLRVIDSIYIGLVLVFGYYSKSLFFYLVPFVVAGSLLISAASIRAKVCSAIIMIFTFLLLTSPYIVAISAQNDRFTIGDSGKINYGIFVSGDAYRYDKQNLTDENLLLISPDYPFHNPLHVDRVVWELNSANSFKFKPFFSNILINILRLFTANMIYGASLLLFIYVGAVNLKYLFIKKYFWIILPFVCAICAYVLILVMHRYVNPFLSVLGVLMLAIAVKQKNVYRFAALTIFAGFGLFMLLLAAKALAFNEVRFESIDSKSLTNNQLSVADNMSRYSGESICFIGKSRTEMEGKPYPSSFEMWLRYSGCYLRAVYPFSQDFYTLSDVERNRLYDILKENGIYLVVLYDPPNDYDRLKEMEQIGQDYYLIKL